MKGKVLIFIDWFEPGYRAGGPITSNVNITEHLCDEIDFYVITSDTDYRETTPYTDITPNCWTERNGIHVYYFSKEKLGFRNIAHVAREANCPVWYINGVYSRYFSLYPLIAARIQGVRRTIVSSRGMLSPHALAVKSYKKKCFLGLEKLLGLYHKVIFHSTNKEESDYIKATMGEGVETTVIENLPRKMNVPFSPITKQKGAVRLTSFARISPEKNTLYAIEALAGCKTQVYYDIYGQINDMAYWEQCQKAILQLPANVIVQYRGSAAPHEIPRLYRDYDAMYLPTTGENFGHAILESFTNSRPVVISDRTPWQDLAKQGVGYDLSLDDKSGFAQMVDLLSEMDADSYEEMCRSAYKYARSVSHNPTIRQKYLSLFTK